MKRQDSFISQGKMGLVKIMSAFSHELIEVLREILSGAIENNNFGRKNLEDIIDNEWIACFMQVYESVF